MVDVLLSLRAGFLAAFLGSFGLRALVRDVGKGWPPRGCTTARDELGGGGRLVVLSQVDDDVGCGWWFRLCPFW